MVVSCVGRVYGSVSGIVSVLCGMRVVSVRVPIVSCVRLYTCMSCVCV